jgi:hypothetical protein
LAALQEEETNNALDLSAASLPSSSKHAIADKISSISTAAANSSSIPTTEDIDIDSDDLSDDADDVIGE